MFITIYGKTGATQKMHLKAKNSNTFQQGRSDTFKVHSNCVGPLKRIRIEHDNKGLAPGWFLERVSITKTHLYSMGHDARKPVLGVRNRSDTNWPVLKQKNARCLKFWI